MTLQLQLAEAQCDATDARNEKEKCVAEWEIERQKLQTGLDAAIVERKKLETKWQNDFENLRTVNSDREEHLLQDCEWKLRSTEQMCKAKVMAAEAAKNEAINKSKEIETESKRQFDEVIVLHYQLLFSKKKLLSLFDIRKDARFTILNL